MNDKIQKAPMVPPFVRFVCSAVPMVFDDSLSYYEALSALWKWLQDDVVNVININATVTEEYINLTNELKTFVEDYFVNLDVQEEINNKLDAMVEDGTLDEIINQEIFSDLNNRLNTTEQLTNDIDAELTNQKCGLIGFAVDNSDNHKGYLNYSLDGVNFLKVGTAYTDLVNDASSMFEINGVFYILSNNFYRYSTDLVTWSDKIYINPNYSRRIWASALYYDPVLETVYVYSSYQYNDDTLTTPYGGTSYYFKIAYQTATINSDGSLNIDDTVHDILYDEGESYIDGYVLNDKYLGFIMAYKNEATAYISIRKMNSATIIADTVQTCPAKGIEAPQLIQTQDGVVCYCECYAIGNVNYTGIDMPRSCAYFHVSLKNTLYEGKLMGLVPIKTTYRTRHMGICKPSKIAYRKILQLGIYGDTPFIAWNENVRNGRASYTIQNNSILINLPYTYYQLTGSRTVTLKPSYKYEHYYIFGRKGNVVTWSNDSDIQSSCKGHTYTFTEDKLLDIIPDARDAIGGTWVPIDRT